MFIIQQWCQIYNSWCGFYRYSGWPVSQMKQSVVASVRMLQAEPFFRHEGRAYLLMNFNVDGQVFVCNFKFRIFIVGLKAGVLATVSVWLLWNA